jgi:Protein of unknown function (DUF3105)
MVDQQQPGKPGTAKSSSKRPAAASRKQQQRKGPAGKGKLVKGAAARREAERRRRMRAIGWTTAVVVVIVALVGVILWQGRDTSLKLTSPSASQLAAATEAAGASQVQTFAEAGRDHIGPDAQPRNWNSQPPTSGDHLGTPLPRGIYRDQQDERALVHNLEHGYVVLQYKNLPEDQVETLTRIAEGLAEEKFVLAPYDGLPADGLALTAWRHLQTAERVNIDVISAFVNDFMVPRGERSVAPEPNAI